jgi:hypothetical protein
VPPLTVLVAAAPLLLGPGPPGPSAPAVIALVDAPVGGSVFVCAATGILFGASILTGNALGAAGAALSAYVNGCF